MFKKIVPRQRQQSVSSSNVHIQAVSKLNKNITITRGYWDIITRVKHPAAKGKERAVKEALKNPEYIRRSKTDDKVYLFYKKQKKYHLCVVVRHLNGDGFIITVYITDKIKEGEQVWPKKQSQN